MKKIKNLSMLLIAVIMSSTGLVSCIDNDISPVVEDIYRNQALLIASQAQLNSAKAAYEQAKAALDNARAAAVTSAASDASQAQDDASAAAAQHLSEHEAALEQTIALYAIALENALLDLEEAKMLWEAKMIELQADIDAAGVLLASGYFTDYTTARGLAIIQEGLAVLKQSAIETAQLLINDVEGVSWEYFLAQQNGILAGLEGELAAKQAAAANLAAVIADPSTAESKKSELEAMVVENEAAMVALETEMAELDAEKVPYYAELYSLFGLDSDYHDKKYELMDAEEDVEDLMYEIDDRQMYIDYLVDDIASYDADVIAAEAAEAAADAALTAADAAYDAAVTVKDDAEDVMDDSAADVVTAQAAWDAQAATVNAAAAALVVALNLTDGGAQDDLDAAILAQVDTDAEYALAKSLFDADPAGSTYVEGEHNGLDGVLGDYSDTANGAFATSHRLIATVTVGPLVVTWADAILVGDPTGLLITAGPYSGLTAGADGTYFDVEEDDDTPDANVDRFAAATTAKLAADDAVDDAQDIVDGIDLAGDIALAQAEYDAQVVIFEGQQELVDAAQVIADADEDLYDAASDAASDAYDVMDDAQDDFDDAEYALMDLEDYTPADMQDDIDTYSHEIDVMTILLAISEARVTELISEIADIEAEIQAAGSGSAWEALIVLNNASEVLEDEYDALGMMNYQLDMVIGSIAMNNADLQADLDACWTSIGTLEDSIEAQEVLIALGQIDEAAAQAAITQLENELAGIEAMIDGYNDLATKYWALMQAALAA